MRGRRKWRVHLLLKEKKPSEGDEELGGKPLIFQYQVYECVHVDMETCLVSKAIAPYMYILAMTRSNDHFRSPFADDSLLLVDLLLLLSPWPVGWPACLLAWVTSRSAKSSCDYRPPPLVSYSVVMGQAMIMVQTGTRKVGLKGNSLGRQSAITTATMIGQNFLLPFDVYETKAGVKRCILW